MVKNKTYITYIAVAAGFIFLILFFGNRIPFPRIFVFDLFQNNVSNVQNVKIDLSDDRAGVNNDKNILNDFEGSTLIFDLAQGTGMQAEQDSVVSVGYIGTYVNDAGEEVEFDRNINSSTPFTFTLGANQVIPGFEEGVLGMREGGQRIIIIKPEAGYGNRQAGSIPPNTTLQFIIELYEVQ